jgi:hypothetical protein
MYYILWLIVALFIIYVVVLNCCLTDPCNLSRERQLKDATIIGSLLHLSLERERRQRAYVRRIRPISPSLATEQMFPVSHSK